MLYNIGMARGKSGRIVLEIDPSRKDSLYAVLTRDGMTLKDWFLEQAEEYMANRGQMSHLGPSAVAEDQAHYETESTFNATHNKKSQSNLPPQAKPR